MDCIGVIAEYNPFHNGHAHQLAEAKRRSSRQYAVAAMSGSFVQRGEPALLDKHTRARLALQNGADLVLELPTACALSGAEGFARGGAALLRSTGLVDALSFGSECGDLALLNRAQAALAAESPAAAIQLRALLRQGKSFVEARAAALSQNEDTALAAVLRSPNDILAIEYLRALHALAWDIPCYPIPRTVPHDAQAQQKPQSFASASQLRAAARGGLAAFSHTLPANAAQALWEQAEQGGLRGPEQLGSALLYALRRMSRAQLAALPGISEGFENVVCKACRDASDYRELLALLKTRRYPMARIKRMLMCALLGITAAEQAQAQSGLYIRVLGVRKDAVDLLSLLAERAALPVVAQYADVSKLNAAQRQLHALDCLAAEIAALSCDRPTPARFDYSRPLITV